jgi:hypothetical protein
VGFGRGWAGRLVGPVVSGAWTRRDRGGKGVVM